MVQVLFIHGGTTFKTKSDYLKYISKRKITLKKTKYWTPEYLDQSLGKSYEVIYPRMPCKENARYTEWKITFENYLKIMEKEIILIGCSLGGIFLAKYLSENRINKKLISVNLVCPPFDSTERGDLAGGFQLKTKLDLLQKQSFHLNLYFSENDTVVPLEHAALYKKKLPLSNLFILNDKNGHFIVPEFPELIKKVKSDYRSFKKLVKSKN